jgi:hypothetical protein
MSKRWMLSSLLIAAASGPLAAQAAPPVTMPAGDYVIQARDSSKAADVAIVGWPFVLKGNGTFTMTTPDSLVFAGKIVQKDGLATYTDQQCADPGVYFVRRERQGYAFDMKSEACAGRDAGWTKLLFVPGKPGKTP